MRPQIERCTQDAIPGAPDLREPDLAALSPLIEEYLERRWRVLARLEEILRRLGAAGAH